MTISETVPQARASTWRLILVSPLVIGLVAGLALDHPEQTHAVLSRLARLQLLPLGITLILVVLQLLLQSLRQWAVIPRRFAMSPTAVWRPFVLGEWLNMFAPARAGDALRATLLADHEGRSAPALAGAAGAVLADKVADIVALVILCAAAGLLGMLWARARVILLIAAVVAAAALGAWLWLSRPARAAGRAHAWLADTAHGLDALRDPGRAGLAVLLAIGAWVAEAAALVVICAALGSALTPAEAMLAMVALNVGIAVPVSFANLGTYEAAMAAGLVQAGVPLPVALAAAASHHGIELLAASLASATALAATALRK